jgi:hypothetical protein
MSDKVPCWPYSIPEKWEPRAEGEKGIIRKTGLFAVTITCDIYRDPIYPVLVCVHRPEEAIQRKSFKGGGEAILWANSCFENDGGSDGSVSGA